MIKSVSEDSFTQFFFPKGVVRCILETILSAKKLDRLVGQLVFLKDYYVFFLEFIFEKNHIFKQNHLERPQLRSQKFANF